MREFTHRSVIATTAMAVNSDEATLDANTKNGGGVMPVTEGVYASEHC